MTLKIDLHSPEWWAWAITLVALALGLAGWRTGFEAAVAVSLAQCLWFAAARGATAFATQVRYVYFALAVIAYVDPTRILYALLAIGTLMVVLFDRCMIARVLAKAPWNAGVAVT